MNGLQYTIRSVSPKLDKILRNRATKTGKTLNETVLETLQKDSGLSQQSQKPVIYHDLDSFVGSGIEDTKAFDDAQISI